MRTPGTASGLVGIDDVRAAGAEIAGVALRTPLLACPWLSNETGGEVRLKCESLQRVGAFKMRGAYTYVSRIPAAERSRGVITYSSGNHAQAVAQAARLHGIPATVVMPTTAPRVKRDGAAALGAEIVIEGTTSVERRARAESIAAERGLAMVPPFDDPDIIAGQGTVALECVEDWPELDTFFVPVGGGGLISGCAAALRALAPHARIYGVEPEGAASMSAALAAGRPVRLPEVRTIADGLAPVEAGELTYRHVRDLVDEVLLVSDSEIRQSASILLRSSKLVVEFSGAAAVAAARSGRVSLEGKRAVAVLSGGNLDPSLVSELLGA